MAGLNIIALFGVFIILIAASSVSGIKCRFCKIEYNDFSFEKSSHNIDCRYIKICNNEENQVQDFPGIKHCGVITILNKTTDKVEGQYAFPNNDVNSDTPTISKDIIDSLDRNKYTYSYSKCSKDLCSDDILSNKCRWCKQEYGDFNFERHLPELKKVAGPNGYKTHPNCNNKGKQTGDLTKGIYCGVLTIWDVTNTGIIVGQLGLPVENVNKATDEINKALKSTDKLKYMHSFSTCRDDLCSDVWLQDRSPVPCPTRTGIDFKVLFLSFIAAVATIFLIFLSIVIAIKVNMIKENRKKEVYNSVTQVES